MVASSTSRADKGNFKNAIEAFAHGRQYNALKKSLVDLNDVIGNMDLFEHLQYNSVLRSMVLEAEHFFEACMTIKVDDPKANW